ncbi:hypothetical protein MNBD_PLANCTO03-2317, partial [hydrothermal vent metagenome]
MNLPFAPTLLQEALPQRAINQQIEHLGESIQKLAH